jgi:hypothetical protein
MVTRQKFAPPVVGPLSGAKSGNVIGKMFAGAVKPAVH